MKVGLGRGWDGMGASPISPASIIKADPNRRCGGVEREGTRMRRPRFVEDISGPADLPHTCVSAHVCVHRPEKTVVLSSSCVDRLVETVTGVQQRKQEFLLD